jgi:hypothetical protein
MQELFYPTKIRQVAQDIYQTPFLTTVFVDVLIEQFLKSKKWSLETFKYSTQDLYLETEYSPWFEVFQTKEVELQDYFCKNLHVGTFGFYSIFAVKYQMDEQRSLDIHHDDSFISGSIKLTTEYTGGNLEFPRQKFSALDVPAGDLLLWPSTVTHPHRCTELTSGSKYSLTLWTKEHEDN